MRILTEPEIYVVGRQSLDSDEVRRFLEDHETSWQTDSERGSELIVELAGRTCFDQETEILTDQGWKRFGDLDRTEEVLTLNPETRFVEFQMPIAYQAYAHHGMLKCIDGRDISFAVTPDHRQFGHFPRSTDRFVCTEEIGAREFHVISAGSGWIGKLPTDVGFPEEACEHRVANQYGSYSSVAVALRPKTIVERGQIVSLALLLAYYATEGSLRHVSGSGQGITIYGDHVAEVGALCDALELPWSTSRDPRNGVPRVAVGGGRELRQFFEDYCGKGSQNKQLPHWVLNLPLDALSRIWDVLVKTDGHHYQQSGREILCTTSPVLAGQAQELLCKLGYASCVLLASEGVNHPIYVVSRKQGRDIVLNKNAWIEDRHYDGKVYCVTTPNGVIYVRRNGKAHFSGNCYMSFGDKQFRKTNADYVGNLINQGHGSVLEHAVWDLLITGVSRSLTHELVRHRAGTGISQLSQRYVDESTADFVEPAIIAENPELHATWLRAIETAHTAYEELVAGLAAQVEKDHPELKRTPRLKMAREAARSVLPNATETKLLFSANARALRWIITLRGSDGAEPEIRRLAVKLARVMQREAPNLFGDLEIVRLPDGTEGVRVGHHKV